MFALIRGLFYQRSRTMGFLFRLWNPQSRSVSLFVFLFFFFFFGLLPLTLMFIVCAVSHLFPGVVGSGAFSDTIFLQMCVDITAQRLF